MLVLIEILHLTSSIYYNVSDHIEIRQGEVTHKHSEKRREMRAHYVGF